MAIILGLEKDQAEQEAKGVYDKFEKDTGKVPEWVKVMAHNPKVVKEFTELFSVIMKEGYIEPLLRWKIAYTVSQALKCRFCVDVTGKMLESLGADKEIVRKAEGLEEKEREVLELVKKVTETAQCDTGLFKKLKDKFSEAELVEIVSIIGLFNYINRFNNAFCILPE